ncbi:hypothetical protein BOTBODRAFT_154614 [Botryobasidium botryosum FD-172 SS1]|uniref:Phosphoglycerate mutase-like protein n=1 Tax=Botryobasidium botryosum (strain FD-172 SS1) TaxID=930990 RepID=A0A067N4E5_BOTB1|nr:hypothetical protein BOTBODRAFT_154614 [Botryobasidium botryosum FD-172 SS1]
MLERVYIVRHGVRLSWFSSNWDKEASGSGLANDDPLNEDGEVQVQELARHFESLPKDKQPTAIFSPSVPEDRCLQTAVPTSVALGVPIFVETGLAEFLHPVIPGTGLHPRSPNAAALQHLFPQIDPTWSPVWIPSRRGETMAEHHTRMAEVARVLLPSATRNQLHRSILIVTHVVPAIALSRALVNNTELSPRVGCGSITELVRGRYISMKEDATACEDTTAETSAWEPVVVAGTTHLSKGILKDWGFEKLTGKVEPVPGVAGTETKEDSPVGSQVVTTAS